MASSGEYGYDTERNNYPIELLNEDYDRMINTDMELIDAIKELTNPKFEFNKEGGGNKWFDNAQTPCWQWKNTLEEKKWCYQKRVMDEYEKSVEEEENKAFATLKIKMEIDHKNKQLAKVNKKQI
jgi:hypothetical protein